jgi:flagellin
MSLGVLNNISAVYAENNLNNTNNSLSTVLQQLSSGSKINSGADDAAGLSLVNGLQANQQALTQSQTNSAEGVGLLQVADGALSQVTSLLNRAVTLATEASNGTLNSTQDLAANQEYQSILSEVSNIGSTTTYNQEQVFNSNTNIYTGDSSSQGSSIDALNIRTLSSSNLGDTGGAMAYSNGTNNVFLDLSEAGKNASVADTLGTAAQTTTLAVNYMTKGANGSAVSATANVSAGAGTTYANTVQGLISAINAAGLGVTASFGTATEAGSTAVAATVAANTAGSAGTDTGIIISGAGIGAGTATGGADGAGEVGTLNVTNNTSAPDAAGAILAGTLAIVGSNGATHNITLGTANSTDTLANLASTINAANYGVTAVYNATTAVPDQANIVFNSADSAVTVAQTSATLTGTGTGTDVVALNGTPTAAGTQQSTAIASFTGAPTVAGVFTIGANTPIVVGIAETYTTLAAAINAGKYGVTASLNAAGTVMTISSPNSALTPVTDSATSAVKTAIGTTSSAYYSVGISNAAAIADTSTLGGTANIGLVGDFDGTGGTATISYADSAGQSLSQTDLTNATDAQAALTDLNTAISDVAAQDGYVGAQINTLNAVSQVLSTQQENVQSAQNAVQATDYASATSNMSKYEILSQTGISALAQANSIQQEVTKLLQ